MFSFHKSERGHAVSAKHPKISKLTSAWKQRCSPVVPPETHDHVQPTMPPDLQSMVLTSMVHVMDLMARLHYSSPATSHQLFIRLTLLYRYTCNNNSWRCNGLIGPLLCVCVHVSSSGGDASVSSSSRAGAVLLHSGPAAWSRAGAGHTAGPAGRRTDGHDHPARTDYHRTATARTGTTDALFSQSFPQSANDTRQDSKKWDHSCIWDLIQLW